MTPEEEARQKIDVLLTAAGWAVQDKRDYNPAAAAGVAIREFPLTTGEADYLLVAGRKPVGVVEAKPAGTTLSGVAEQSGKYLLGVPDYLPKVGEKLTAFSKQGMRYKGRIVPKIARTAMKNKLLGCGRSPH